MKSAGPGHVYVVTGFGLNCDGGPRPTGEMFRADHIGHVLKLISDATGRIPKVTPLLWDISRVPSKILRSDEMRAAIVWMGIDNR